MESILENLLQSSDRRRARNPFNTKIADQIISYAADGLGINAICGMPGMPSYQVVCKWRRQNNEFNKMLLAAYEDYISEIQYQIYLATIPLYRNPQRIKFLKKQISRIIGFRYSKFMKQRKKRVIIKIETGIGTRKLILET